MTDSLCFLSPGYLIGDKFCVTQAIGSGGMGVVYEATHTRLGQRVAVKMLLPDLAQNKDAVARFEREARAVAHLRSSHVARVFDVDTLPDGTPYIVMEYLEGRDLAAELAARGPLPIAEAVTYLLQACDAMAEAHQLGIVHRDLKPGNLFLAVDGRRSIVKVLDFGISKVADEALPGLTTTRSGLGTAVYMSPEQVRSAKHVDARSDVWSLGVVLYEMLTGCQPFLRDTAAAVAAAIVADPPDPLRTIREDIPPALERIVMRALEKDRDRRFADAAAFAAEIAPFASRPVVPDADRTLQSPLPVDMLLPRPRGASASLTGDGLVRGELNSPPAVRRTGVRVAKGSPRRTLATWGALGVAVLALAAVVREMARESTNPSPSASPQILASPLTATTGAPPGLQGNAVQPSEVESVAPATSEAHGDVVAPPAASAVQPPATRPTGPAKSLPRTAPASTSRPPTSKDSAGSASSARGGTVPKLPQGLPPDPG